MLRAGMYARVSTLDQQTLPMQIRALREYAAKRGWTVAEECRDVGSGAVARAMRQRLIDSARRRDIDVVVVWRLDRWGRSVADLVSTLQELTGVIMGASFGKIVGTFTDGIIMPPIGKMMGGIDFNNILVNLSDKPVKTLAEAKAAGIPVMTTGMLLTDILNFLIVATVLFMLVKAVNKMKKEAPAPASAPAPAGPTPDQKLLSEIRDLLSARAKGAVA